MSSFTLRGLIRNKLVQNTGYLSIIEIFRLLMPFIALPYIIKTVGVTNYGSIVFAQAIISYFQIFINWGLDISAVKDVSISRNNPGELNRIVSSVLLIKLLYLLLSASFSIVFYRYSFPGLVLSRDRKDEISCINKVHIDTFLYCFNLHFYQAGR